MDTKKGNGHGRVYSSINFVLTHGHTPRSDKIPCTFNYIDKKSYGDIAMKQYRLLRRLVLKSYHDSEQV